MIKPINNNVAIIYEEVKEKTTESGIILGGNLAEDKSQPAMAIVSGVGPTSTIGVKVGDVVLWNRTSRGFHENTHIVDESTLLAIVETE
jgi:co-chaperonin GroES (HSP10)